MNVHILSFIQVDTCRTLSSKDSLRSELSANPIVTISFVPRCSLFTGVILWLLEYHSLLLTQAIHYITTNHHAVQVSIASGMSMNAGNRNRSEVEKSKVLHQNKMISTCLIKFWPNLMNNAENKYIVWCLRLHFNWILW